MVSEQTQFISLKITAGWWHPESRHSSYRSVCFVSLTFHLPHLVCMVSVQPAC